MYNVVWRDSATLFSFFSLETDHGRKVTFILIIFVKSLSFFETVTIMDLHMCDFEVCYIGMKIGL